MRNSFRVCLLLGAALLALAPARAGAQTPPLYTKWVNYTHANGMPEGEVYSVAIAGNQVWAGTANGLALIENGRVKKVFTTKDGLAGQAVMSVAVDPQTGDVWAATFGGLSRYSAGQFKNYTNLTSGLANDLVYAVAIQGKYVWAATAAGVSRLDRDTGDWHIFNEQNSPFDEPWAYAIAFSKEKAYLGLWGGGVIVYDLARHFWRPYTDPDGSMEIVLYRNQGLIHMIVSSVAYNPDTKMFWAGTYFGLSGYDGRNWHNYLTKDSGLASDFINGVQSRGDEVWACTQQGLSELDYKTNTWVTYRPADWQALDAAKAEKAGRGEILITQPDGRKSRIETPTSLPHNYILNMAFQGKDIWVATADGLSHGIRQSDKEEQHNESAANRH
ncbi:MAG TPA: regulator [Terriglobia bacterium]|nr:regulator [Terriglobia bacterium]